MIISPANTPKCPSTSVTSPNYLGFMVTWITRSRSIIGITRLTTTGTQTEKVKLSDTKMAGSVILTWKIRNTWPSSQALYQKGAIGKLGSFRHVRRIMEVTLATTKKFQLWKFAQTMCLKGWEKRESGTWEPRQLITRLIRGLWPLAITTKESQSATSTSKTGLSERRRIWGLTQRGRMIGLIRRCIHTLTDSTW